MVRPTNLPSPHITKLGEFKKPPAKSKSGIKTDASVAKKKKKQKKDKSQLAAEKGSTKKKRMKKVPQAVVEQIAAMKARSRAEREVRDVDVPDVAESKIEVVTSAAVKRVATRVGIACISNEASELSFV